MVINRYVTGPYDDTAYVGSAGSQYQRQAAALRKAYKSQALLGKAGERIEYGVQIVDPLSELRTMRCV